MQEKAGDPMQTIEVLKKNVKGVEVSFLIKDKDIVECDLEGEGMYFLAKNIVFLSEFFLESHKNVRKMSIIANRHCRVFFDNPYVLGVVVAKETNFPLLDMVSHKLLYTIEETPEVVEEAVDEVLQRMDSFFK